MMDVFSVFSVFGVVVEVSCFYDLFLPVAFLPSWHLEFFFIPLALSLSHGWVEGNIGVIVGLYLKYRKHTSAERNAVSMVPEFVGYIPTRYARSCSG
jgi:hypothetical protein